MAPAIAAPPYFPGAGTISSTLTHIPNEFYVLPSPVGCSPPALPPFRERTKRFVGHTFATPVLSYALPAILS